MRQFCNGHISREVDSGNAKKRYMKKKYELDPGIEPGSWESEPHVLTDRLIERLFELPIDQLLDLIDGS